MAKGRINRGYFCCNMVEIFQELLKIKEQKFYQEFKKITKGFGAQINGIVIKAKSSFENMTTIIKSFMSFET
ncbi:hypothetical protein T03_236 [Trichinella britovi]|uniref:Uncharacterized protein n=1 Tax=Trichinella britovi TaxID=45882 RepID=A0A0V1DIF7_TRIBR|nr:hypothetical protein T03_236 [Trichinella britovi]